MAIIKIVCHAESATCMKINHTCNVWTELLLKKSTALLSNIPIESNYLHSCIIKSVTAQVAGMTSMQVKISQTLLWLVKLDVKVQLSVLKRTLESHPV